MSGLALIGLADEDEDAIRRLGMADYDPGEDEHVLLDTGSAHEDEERTGWEEGYLEDDSWPPRRRQRETKPGGQAWALRDAENPRGYAGRYTGIDEDKPIPDWDWPRYDDVDRPPAGDYWTPVPDDLYNAPGLDALPPVPDYEPATGFDMPLAPTGPAPEWPLRERRVRLPRSWSERDAQPRGTGDDDAEGRPSPRPRPSAPYVSRHSAGPH